MLVNKSVYFRDWNKHALMAFWTISKTLTTIHQYPKIYKLRGKPILRLSL